MAYFMSESINLISVSDLARNVGSVSNNRPVRSRDIITLVTLHFRDGREYFFIDKSDQYYSNFVSVRLPGTRCDICES